MLRYAHSRLGYKCTADIVKHQYFADFDMHSFVDRTYVPVYVPASEEEATPACCPGPRDDCCDDELHSHFEAYTGEEAVFSLL
jgi:hypothetical protein